MKYLLDTHAVVFAIADPDKLSQHSRALIVDPKSRLFVSWITIWEITLLVNVKQIVLKTGRRKLGTFIEHELALLGIKTLPYTTAQMSCFALLPVPLHPTRHKPHTDPFDRGIIACGLVHNLPIITKDGAFSVYAGITTVW